MSEDRLSTLHQMVDKKLDVIAERKAMEASMPTVDRKGLRERLARTIDPDSWARYDHYHASGRKDSARDEIAGWLIAGSLKTSDAAIAGPLSALLAQADTAERMEAVLRKYEPRFRTDALRPELQTLEERVAFACNEAIDGREGERRLAERAGITLDATATDDPAALLNALRAAAVENARLSAEVEALRAALKPFADAAEVNDNDTLASLRPDREVVWSATGSWGPQAPVTIGHFRAARTALTCTTDQPDPGAREGSSLPVEGAVQEDQPR